MKTPAAKYPALARLFGAYLHQDYDLEDASAEAAVERFAREVDPDVRDRAKAELARLLKAARTETALQAVLDDLGCAHQPKGAKDPVRAWLTSLLPLLA